jgi:DNA helicase-2/ATP-dependent DNA helicase PcrA
MSEQTTKTILEQNLERFNPAQRQAATTTLGPMLVVAGAGSGKTSVLTTRIALLLSQGVDPERILALTFTKKAADEMRSRIISMEGDAARRIVMGTFHSVFIRFLRPYAQYLNFPQNFTVLDEDDSLATLKRCIAETVTSRRPPKDQWTREQELRFKEEDKAYKPKTIRSIISMAKNDLVTADAYAADPERQRIDRLNGRPETGKIFVAYRNACHRMAMMDFDDILLYTDILLTNYPDVACIIASQFQYVLVDEYQDTNVAQYSILRKLTRINKNICVVGDDSQSIYAFRGARIQNIINFKDDYPGCVTVKLEQNYRSTRNIVNAANNLIAKNEGRIPKVCFSDSGKGIPISVKKTADEKAEARFIADTIRQRSRTERRPYSDFAVLYRTNAQSRAIEDALVKARIPYVIYSGTSFFSRMEVKDLMAYYKLAVNPNDNESFARVVNKPVRGVGEAAVRRLFEIASAWGVSLWEAACNPQIALCGFSSKALKGLQEFTQNIADCISVASTRPAHEAATRISDATGFYEEYAGDTDEESRKRADNLRELVDSVRSYEEDVEARNRDLDPGQQESPTLAGYLQTTMLLSNADTGGLGDDKVSLMTVHCAKGLEFDTVFVAGVEKELFPLEIEGDAFEEEEERRLFYVAMTRAKNTLVLTRAESRLRFGKRKATRPSQFLTEIRSKDARASDNEEE